MEYWRENFEYRILERGADLYYDGAVSRLIRTAEGWKGLIEGTKTYEAEIGIGDGEITDMQCTCTCPYPCKHLAALCFQIEDEPALAEAVLPYEDLDACISQMNVKELRLELKRAAEKDSSTKQRLLCRRSENAPSPRDLIMISRQLEKEDRMLDACGADMNSLDRFADTVSDLINDTLDSWVESGFFREAFEVIRMVCDILSQYDTDPEETYEIRDELSCFLSRMEESCDTCFAECIRSFRRNDHSGLFIC